MYDVQSLTWGSLLLYSSPLCCQLSASREEHIRTCTEDEKGTRAVGTKETSIGDECRKQIDANISQSCLWWTRRLREDSISYLFDNRSSIEDAVSLPFPHKNPGELIFDKGPLNFFVKQNLTRCRVLGNPGKKYLRVYGRRRSVYRWIVWEAWFIIRSLNQSGGISLDRFHGGVAEGQRIEYPVLTEDSEISRKTISSKIRNEITIGKRFKYVL